MTRLAEAYEAAAEALAALALEIRAVASQDGLSASLPGGPTADTSWTETDDYPDLPPQEAKPAGSAAVCPAHGTEYREGKYGPYCPNLGTDPKWTNERGYCTLTPKNAAAYLRQKAQR